jgi:ATP/maltotriose-dependent transcriptional regulator MalT
MRARRRWPTGGLAGHHGVVSGGDLASPVLVGRQDELERLRRALSRVQAGEPAVALIAGEAGVGKTRLVQEILREAAQAGARVLTGSCVELGGEGIPLSPLVDALRGLARSTSAEELDQLLGPAREQLARLLPELDPAAPPATAQDGSAAQLLEHVLGVITRLAAGRQLVLVMEDLHWADRSTRDLVEFLIRTLRELAVLLVLTYRSDALHRGHPLRPLVTEWERVRSVERLDVGRFTPDEVAAQLRAIRRVPVTTQLADAVYQRSQGNAFLVEEIAGVVETGGDPYGLPPSLRDVLLARTERVSETAQRVLRTASVAGTRVEDRLLAAVAGTGEDELYAGLREAVDHHLLTVNESGSGYAFRHALTRDAVYRDLLPGERVRLHAGYGQALTADPSLAGDDLGSGGVAATLAHHWYAARDRPRALTASVRAGELAAAGNAPAEALHHWERALEIWPGVADAPARAGLAWATLVLLAAEAANNAGDTARALSLIEQALGDQAVMGDPVRRAEVIVQRAMVLRGLGQDEEAAAELQDILAELPPELTHTHALALALLANSLRRIGQDAQGHEMARRAAQVAAEVGATATRADALITFGSTSAYQGDAEEGLAALHDVLALAIRADLPFVALRGYVNLSDVQEMLGMHAAAAETARSGILLAERAGLTRSLGTYLVGNLTEPLIRLGRWQEAQDLITEALGREPEGVYASSLLLQQAELALWRGDPQAAGQDVLAALRQLGEAAETQFTAPVAFIEAELSRASGNPAAARGRIAPLLKGQIDGVRLRYTWPLIWLAMRVEADIAGAASHLAAAGDDSRAPLLLELAARLPARTPPARAYRALALAEAARLPGTGGQSEGGPAGAWQEAVAAVRAAQEALPLCYGLFRLAEALVAVAQRDAAAEAAREGIRLADEMGAALGQELRDFASRARLRVDTPAAGPGEQAGRFHLTDREREVLKLVADGRSNSEIAAALFISPKTVSVHASNIFAKLGVSGRAQATALVHRLGLFPDDRG